jgi:outer membrane immunogenic protein
MSVLNRKLFLISVFALFLTSVAGAGDLPFQMPIVTPVPAFSWTGVYLGIGGGTGWGNNAYTWNQDATLAAVAAQMPNPGTPPQLGPTQGSLPISGGYLGGQVGGNWQVERAVFGIQADAH